MRSVSTLNTDFFENKNLNLYVLIYRSGDEERSLPDYSIRIPPELPRATIELYEDQKFRLDGAITSDWIYPHSADALVAQFQRYEHVILDITGLPTPLWARIIQILYEKISIWYTEPRRYRKTSGPEDDFHEDLTETIIGISSLPGFKRVGIRRGERTVLIPMLGFEGARFALISKQYEEYADEMVPVVGVPGYRLHYPFLTYLANKRVLTATKAWHLCVYAAAYDPIETRDQLVEVVRKNRFDHAILAPIGTKPQALGAVLAAIEYPEIFELIYDFPIKKSGRTSGRRRTWVYILKNV